MNTINNSKERDSLKAQVRKVKALIGVGFFLLMSFFLLAGCFQKAPININGDNLEKLVSINVNEYLDKAVSERMIKQYQHQSIQTPIDTFRVIAQEHLEDGATLHPNLTYKIKYWGSNVFSKDKECEAMAYSFVKDGKLYGSGVVISEVIIRGVSTIYVFGDNSKESYMTVGELSALIFLFITVFFGFLMYIARE